MKEYENALRKIDEEMEKVEDEIEMYAVKRDNERDRFMKITLEEDVQRLIGVYNGLYKAYCIVKELEEGKKK